MWERPKGGSTIGIHAFNSLGGGGGGGGGGRVREGDAPPSRAKRGSFQCTDIFMHVSIQLQSKICASSSSSNK